jgi:Na+-transporting NADH:ubiquinone oxidoreductase subunit NqrE
VHGEGGSGNIYLHGVITQKTACIEVVDITIANSAIFISVIEDISEIKVQNTCIK